MKGSSLFLALMLDTVPAATVESSSSPALYCHSYHRWTWARPLLAQTGKSGLAQGILRHHITTCWLCGKQFLFDTHSKRETLRKKVIIIPEGGMEEENMTSGVASGVQGSVFHSMPHEDIQRIQRIFWLKKTSNTVKLYS